ncbi:MAG: hypothetical protein GWP19_12370 [Planctomycetia bacterium]|nr:hypothetical protein [Planctomycetia bacterium]
MMKIKYLILYIFICVFNLYAQNSTFLQEYYFANYDGQDHFILDKELVHAKYGNDIDLFAYNYQGAIVWVEQNQDTFLLTFILDPAWNKLVYGDYEQEWVKIYGEFGFNDNGWNHPRSIALDGNPGNIYVADNGNRRIVKLTYNFTNNEINSNSFSTIGEGILNSPWTLPMMLSG